MCYGIVKIPFNPQMGQRELWIGHRKILLALRLKDPELCERTMRDHIKQAKEDALQTLIGVYKK
jgi:DNA-binding GntR family transcriptional regulator